jgi:hypothetical protein
MKVGEGVVDSKYLVTSQGILLAFFNISQMVSERTRDEQDDLENSRCVNPFVL